MDCTQRMPGDDVVDNHLQEEIGYLGICGETHPIKMGPNKIGRDANCCDIIINHASLSRQHAVINVLTATNFMLMDLGSVNKTKLGIKILQPYLPHTLKNGDTIQFGEVFGVFILNEVDSQIPQTQAFTCVPDTPVHCHLKTLQGSQPVTIPESPDFNNSEDDSFILSSQQQGNSFHLLNKNVIRHKKTPQPVSLEKSKNDSNDSIFWNASTRSPSINFNLEESDSSINEGKKETIVNISGKKILEVDNGDIEVTGKENVENIHEALTQLPSPPARVTGTSIQKMDTQIIGNVITAKHNLPRDNNLSHVEDIDIHEQTTQLDVSPEKINSQNIESHANVGISIHEAETQDFINEKKVDLSSIDVTPLRSVQKINDKNLIDSTANVSIHEAETQEFLFEQIIDLSVNHVTPPQGVEENNKNSIDSLANVSIHEAETQGSIIEEKINSNPQVSMNNETTMNDAEMQEFLDEETVLIDNSFTKENNSKTLEVSHQNQSTKSIGKAQVENINEDASESDDEIIFDEIESQCFEGREECSQAISFDEDIDENISERKSDYVKQTPKKVLSISENNTESKEKKWKNMRSDINLDSDCSTDCEDIADLPTQKISTNIVMNDNDSTDCEDETDKDQDEVIWDDDEKTVLVPETPKKLSPAREGTDILDICEAPTQILDPPNEIVVEHLLQAAGTCRTVEPNVRGDDISDALTQVLPDILPLSECPTQKIEDFSPIPNKIIKNVNMFKIPISSTPFSIKKKSPICVRQEKNIISPASSPKIADGDHSYNNTQELMDDLLTQKEDFISNLSDLNPNSSKVSNIKHKKTVICEKKQKIDSCVTPLDRQCYDTTQDILADLLTQKIPEENQRHINRENITGNKLADKISQYSGDMSDIESQDIDLLSLSRSSIPPGAGRSEISSGNKMMNTVEEEDDEIIPSSQENDSIDENMRFPGITKSIPVQRNDAGLAQKSDVSSGSEGVTAANIFVASLTSQQVRDCIGADDLNEFYKTPTPILKITTPRKSSRFSTDTSDNDNTPIKSRNQPKMGVLDVELPDSQDILKHISRLPNCTIVETSSDSDSNPEAENTPVVHRRKVPSKRKKLKLDGPNITQLALPTRVITRKRSPTEKLSANTKLKSIITNKVLQVEEDENPLDHVNAEIINENLKRLSNERHKKTTKDNSKNRESKDNVESNEQNKHTSSKKSSKQILSGAKDGYSSDQENVVIHTENLKNLINGRHQKSTKEKSSTKAVKKKQDSKNNIKTDTQSEQRRTRRTSNDANSQQNEAGDGSGLSAMDSQYSRRAFSSKSQDFTASGDRKIRSSSRSLSNLKENSKEKEVSKRTSKRTTKSTGKGRKTNEKTNTMVFPESSKDNKEMSDINEQPVLRSTRHKKINDSQSLEDESTKHTKQNDKSKDDKNVEMINQKLDKSNTSAEDVRIQRTRSMKDVKSEESSKLELIKSNSSQDDIMSNKRTRNTKQKVISDQNLDRSNTSEEYIIIQRTSSAKYVETQETSELKLIKSNDTQDAINDGRTRNLRNAKRKGTSNQKFDNCNSVDDDNITSNTASKYSKRIEPNKQKLIKAISSQDEINNRRTRNTKDTRKKTMSNQKLDDEPPTKIKKNDHSSRVTSNQPVSNNVSSPHNTRKRPITPGPIVVEHSTPSKIRRNKEDLDSHTSPSIARIGTPSRLSLRPKQNVMFTAFTDPKKEAVVKKLGASIVSDPLACTVVVTPHIKRTVKLLCAIGLGRPIVGPSWIEACQNANALVDPWLYLLKDSEAEKRFKFSLAKTLRGSRNFLSGKIVSGTASILPAPHEMQSIVECSGGSWCDPFKGGPASWLCLSTATDWCLWPALRSRGATILSVEAVLSGVLQQTLHTRTHILKGETEQTNKH